AGRGDEAGDAAPGGEPGADDAVGTLTVGGDVVEGVLLDDGHRDGGGAVAGPGEGAGGRQRAQAIASRSSRCGWVLVSRARMPPSNGSTVAADGVATATKTLPSITVSSVSVAAVTVAVRGMSRSSPISPN